MVRYPHALLVCALVVAGPVAARAQDAGFDAGIRDGGGPRDGGARDGGAPDALTADAMSPDASTAPRDGAAPPMLRVGPTDVPREVFATTAVPTRAVATSRGAMLLTAAEVAEEINRRTPTLRAAFTDPVRVEQLARDLVRDRVLAEAARRAGLLEDAEVKRELERTLARVLLERAHAADRGPTLDEATARAFYDAHLADYTKPEAVRVLAIVLATREEAVRVRAEVNGVGERRFGVVARRASTDPQSRRRDGSLGWLFVGSRPESTLIEAALALRVGETAALPLEIDGRFYIVRTVERRAPEPVTFERARSAIVSRLQAEQRQRVIEVLLARASREQQVVVRPASPHVRVGP